MPPTISIRYSTEPDAPSLGHINIASFQHHAYWKNVFPGAPATALPLKHARCLEKLSAPDVHVLTALEGPDGDGDGGSDRERIVGWARWQIPGTGYAGVELSETGRGIVQRAKDRARETGDGGLLPAGANRVIYENFFAVLKAKRGVWVCEDDLTLDFLATLPECQGRGVGTKLLEWGMEYADERDARIYLEATMEGYPLYLKHGWRKLEELVLDFEPFGGRGTATYIIMMRERRSKRS